MEGSEDANLRGQPTMLIVSDNHPVPIEDDQDGSFVYEGKPYSLARFMHNNLFEGWDESLPESYDRGLVLKYVTVPQSPRRWVIVGRYYERLYKDD